MIVPVILCGGSGTRLWPLSRKDYPKQLLTLSGQYSMLQETVMRLQGLSDLAAPIVICNESYRFVVAEQLREIGVQEARIVLEPCPKNTAAAIAVAAAFADPQSLLLVLPADHQIKQSERLTEAVLRAIPVAENNYLITFGIEPDCAETGYGYIKKGDVLDNTDAFSVMQFVEKPNLEKATEFVASKEYYWNSGMFMFKTSQLLKELVEHAPDIVTACQQAVAHAYHDLDFTRLDIDRFKECPSDSIDYALMEKSKHVAVVPLVNSGWSDLGSWRAIYESKEKDSQANVIKGDVHIKDVTNSFVMAESRLLAVVGVSDHIVIETADAVLVAHKDAAQSIKQIVAELEERQRHETVSHRKVFRPWGFYEDIDQENGFRVKRISVKPGASLSLQMHQHRSEHWIVVRGTAAVTCDDSQFELFENQSTYIPAGIKHRLKNNGSQDLIMIEVQTGHYVGEDDIVRFEDHYGRVTA